jgi:hypothetical protein
MIGQYFIAFPLIKRPGLVFVHPFPQLSFAIGYIFRQLPEVELEDPNTFILRWLLVPLRL